MVLEKFRIQNKHKSMKVFFLQNLESDRSAIAWLKTNPHLTPAPTYIVRFKHFIILVRCGREVD